MAKTKKNETGTRGGGGGSLDSKPNFVNRTLFRGDNLDCLKAINTETIDLIATDPPFNTGRDFHATTPKELKDSEKEKKKIGFQDRWTWDENDVQHHKWIEKVKAYSEDVYHVIQGSRKSYGDDMGAFLCFMAARLLEMRRVLKSTGSIYLHCDPTASHYIKELMDAIFGRKNFKREIIWNLETASGYKSQVNGYIRGHDTILYYTKSNDFTFNKQYKEHKPEYIARFKKVDNGRRYRDDRGGGRRQYLDETKGVALTDVWSDIMSFQQNATSSEIENYPTQKPIALYRRIIEASSNPGDIVLDPFCGCATTLLAAEKFTQGQKRQWVGIDIWDGAEQMVINRLTKEGLLRDPDGEYPSGSTVDFLIGEDEKITYIDTYREPEPDPLPDRTDDGAEAAPDLKVRVVTHKKKKSVYLDRVKAKQDLRKRDGDDCQGCGRNFGDDRYLEVDHKYPKSDGGSNVLENLVLLCTPCNQLKGNVYTLPGLRKENKKRGYMYDDTRLI